VFVGDGTKIAGKVDVSMGISASSGKRLGCVAGLESRLKAKAKSTARAKSKAGDEGVRPTCATSKQWGELAEMMFMVKAAMLGFATAKPYGDSRRYDFIVDVGRRLWRVQVKSTSSLQYGSYMVNLQRNANGEVVPYDPSEIDFVVAYVLPCDAWFVIPVEAIAGRKTAKLCLHGNPRSGKLGKYWQAWGLMTMRWPENE
jgi:PD-(D/E)XK endonuclease